MISAPDELLQFDLKQPTDFSVAGTRAIDQSYLVQREDSTSRKAYAPRCDDALWLQRSLSPTLRRSHLEAWFGLSFFLTVLPSLATFLVLLHTLWRGLNGSLVTSLGCHCRLSTSLGYRLQLFGAGNGNLLNDYGCGLRRACCIRLRLYIRRSSSSVGTCGK